MLDAVGQGRLGLHEYDIVIVDRFSSAVVLRQHFGFYVSQTFLHLGQGPSLGSRAYSFMDELLEVFAHRQFVCRISRWVGNVGCRSDFAMGFTCI